MPQNSTTIDQAGASRTSGRYVSSSIVTVAAHIVCAFSSFSALSGSVNPSAIIAQQEG
ncbi:MAG: hypothetical protein AAF986_06290 [Pseudomonadota bacterium]